MTDVETSNGIYAQTVDLVKELARNPIAELVIGFCLVEKLQDYEVLGSVQGTILEGLMAGLISAQQIAPLVPGMLSAGKDLLSILGSVGALAATKGA